MADEPKRGLAAAAIEPLEVWSVDDHFVRAPRSFVDLDPTFLHDHETPIGEVLPETAEAFRKNSIVIRVSREFALDMGLVEPTDEERAQRAADLEAFRLRDAEERSKPGPRVELGRLLVALAWPAAFAEHLLHPWCSCSIGGEDPSLCSWARDLGFDVTYDEPGLLGWRVIAP